MQDQSDGVSLTQRGFHYAFGRGPNYYGIWAIRPSRVELVERYPLTSDAWFQARRRFEELESLPATTSNSIHLQGPPNRTVTCFGFLILVGVVLGVVGLFPGYLDHASLVSQGDELLPHIFYLTGWTLALLSLFAGSRIARLGAMFGVGLSIVTFGFFLSDLGTAISGSETSVGTGLYLAMIGWILCAAGTIGTLYGLRAWRQHLQSIKPVLPQFVLASVLAIATAVAFAPSWDRFVLYAAASGQREIITEGNAFSNPALVIAGDVFVMVAFVALIALAVSWRKRQLGVALIAGALIPHVAQIFSAVIQLATPQSAGNFGISPAEATQAQLQISAGFTGWFYLYCVCVGLLVLLATWFAKVPTAHWHTSESP